MLDAADRLLIVGVLTLLVLAVLILVVCKFSPLCWMYEVCPLTRDDAEKNKKQKSIYGTDSAYEIRPASPKKKKKKSNKASEKRNSFGTPFVVPIQTAIKPMVEEDKLLQSSEVNGVLKWGQIKLSLQFNENENQLVIKIYEVNDLSSAHLQGTSSMYIKIFVLNSMGHSRTEINTELENDQKELQTKIVKKMNPSLLFDETFIVNMIPSVLKNCQLRIQSVQFDKFSHSNIIGQVILALTDLDLLQELVIWKAFEKYEQELGDILISLSYLPTSERLSVTVIKAKNLKVDNPLILPNPLIKVALSHGKNLLEVRKTAVRIKDSNPLYNENLYFDIPRSEMDRVILTFSVVHKDQPEEDSSEKIILGKAKLGHSIMGSAQKHWKNMKLAPRKSIAQWYSLY